MEHEDIDARIVRQERERILSDRERLLQKFQRLYQKHHQQAKDPRRREPFDISDLMGEQYITRLQALKWLELEGKQYLEELEEILALCVKQAPKLENARSIVSNGPGSGIKTASIYNFFNNERGDNKGNLYLIDASLDILRIAINSCEKEGIPFGKIPRLDPRFFQELGKIPLITEDTNYKFHESLGQTLGNFKDPAEILRRITLNMKKGEYMLLGLLDHGPEAYSDEKFENMNRLLLSELGYFEEAFGNYRAIETEGWNVMSFTLQGEKQERSSKLLEEKFGDPHVLQPGTEIIVARSRRFDGDEVVKLCEKVGLEGVIMETHVDIPTGMEYYATEYGNPSLGKMWAVRGSRRYGLFRKKSPPIMPKVIVAGGMALLGLLGGFFWFQPERPISCTNAFMKKLYTISCQINQEEKEIPFYAFNDIIEEEIDRKHILIETRVSPVDGKTEEKNVARYKTHFREENDQVILQQRLEEWKKKEREIAEKIGENCPDTLNIKEDVTEDMIIGILAPCTKNKRATFKALELYDITSAFPAQFSNSFWRYALTALKERKAVDADFILDTLGDDRLIGALKKHEKEYSNEPKRDAMLDRALSFIGTMDRDIIDPVLTQIQESGSLSLGASVGSLANIVEKKELKRFIELSSFKDSRNFNPQLAYFFRMANIVYRNLALRDGYIHYGGSKWGKSTDEFIKDAAKDFVKKEKTGVEGTNTMYASETPEALITVYAPSILNGLNAFIDNNNNDAEESSYRLLIMSHALYYLGRRTEESDTVLASDMCDTCVWDEIKPDRRWLVDAAFLVYAALRHDCIFNAVEEWTNNLLRLEIKGKDTSEYLRDYQLGLSIIAWKAEEELYGREYRYPHNDIQFRKEVYRRFTTRSMGIIQSGKETYDEGSRRALLIEDDTFPIRSRICKR